MMQRARTQSTQMQALNTGGIDTSVMVNVPESVMRGAADKDLVPYGQLKRSNRRYTFPKTFSFELRFWHNFVPDMPDSSEKLTFQGPPNPGGLHYSVPPPD